MRIDAFAHALPPGFRDAVLTRAPDDQDLVNWLSLRRLFDIEERVALMDALGIDVQIVTTPSPPLEEMFAPEVACQLAEVANREMARLVEAYPDRLRGTATIPLVDPKWAVGELRRAVNELGLLGPLIYTHVNGGPLDGAELEPFWDEAEKLGVPIWLHPDRSRNSPDYVDEDGSRYGLFLVLGWPYETSLAMARLVLSGVIARHPGLEIIVHHGGGMIPFFHRRIEMNYQPGQRRVPMPSDTTVDVKRDLRRFYVDSVLQGATSALATSIDFFGADRVLFATDMPFGPGDGLEFARASLESVEQLPLSQREVILGENAIKLLGIDRP
ncbi:MAG TPA: amidohydrolase family protein [Acidimicrobiia bacterium]|nr:amidohydrolase family protein [Acidimicrobiia bacterium]